MAQLREDSFQNGEPLGNIDTAEWSVFSHPYWRECVARDIDDHSSDHVVTGDLQYKWKYSRFTDTIPYTSTNSNTFGFDVSQYGNFIGVSDPLYTEDGGTTYVGRVHIYDYTTGNRLFTIIDDEPTRYSGYADAPFFGYSIKLFREGIAVGVPGWYSSSVNIYQGCVKYYDWDGNLVETFKASNTAPNYLIGCAVDVAYINGSWNLYSPVWDQAIGGANSFMGWFRFPSPDSNESANVQYANDDVGPYISIRKPTLQVGANLEDPYRGFKIDGGCIAIGMSAFNEADNASEAIYIYSISYQVGTTGNPDQRLMHKITPPASLGDTTDISNPNQKFGWKLDFKNGLIATSCYRGNGATTPRNWSLLFYATDSGIKTAPDYEISISTGNAVRYFNHFALGDNIVAYTEDSRDEMVKVVRLGRASPNHVSRSSVYEINTNYINRPSNAYFEITFDANVFDFASINMYKDRVVFSRPRITDGTFDPLYRYGGFAVTEIKGVDPIELVDRLVNDITTDLK